MFLFQLLVSSLIILSILLSVIVPFFLSSQDSWKNGKKPLFFAFSAWVVLVASVAVFGTAL